MKAVLRRFIDVLQNSLNWLIASSLRLVQCAKCLCFHCNYQNSLNFQARCVMEKFYDSSFRAYCEIASSLRRVTTGSSTPTWRCIHKYAFHLIRCYSRTVMVYAEHPRPPLDMVRHYEALEAVLWCTQNDE